MKQLTLFFFGFLGFFMSSLSAQNIQIQIIPAQYHTILDTIITSPALNAAYDTSNYFVQTQIVVLKEPTKDWNKLKTNKVCIQHNAADYTLVEVKFYPYKNILDLRDAAKVIPAETIIVERQIVSHAAQLKRITAEEGALLNEDEILTLPAYSWQSFQQLLSFCNISDWSSL